MSNKKIAVLVIVLAALGVLVYHKTRPADVIPPVVVEENSIRGCYVATLSKDVYTLKILSQEGEGFQGTLRFKNFEKDSSSGTYVGTYKNGILLGDYSFQSEGMFSVMQVIFKKSGDNFVRGYGNVDSTGTRFTDLNNITYDTSAVFKATPNCPE